MTLVILLIECSFGAKILKIRTIFFLRCDLGPCYHTGLVSVVYTFDIIEPVKTPSHMSHLNTSRAWPLSGDVSLKKGTTRDKLALRRDAPVPLALSATPPTKPPARVSAVVCFFRNFSSGFIPAGMVGRWVGGQGYTGGWRGGGVEG